MKIFPIKNDFTNKSASGVITWPILTSGVLPVTIMLLVTLASVMGYGLATASLDSSRSKTIERILLSNKRRITDGLDDYARIQWGNVGWVQFGGQDEKEWRQFNDIYNISAKPTGVEAIGISYGNDTTNNVIAYINPSNNLTNGYTGYNMGTNPTLYNTMTQATKSGQTALTPTLPNFFSTKQGINSSKNGFLMYTPIYNLAISHSTPDERPQALRGFVVTMFRGDFFFSSLFNDVDLSHTRMQIYLGEVHPENLLYDGGRTTEKNVRKVTQRLTQFGQSMTIIYTFDTEYISVWLLTFFPQILLFSGLLLGALFAVLSGFLLRNRYRRLADEKERDIEFAKDELLSLASHQLRTPATGVKQYLGMVLQGFAGNISEKQREYLNRAYASNNRQLSVINDILHMAKLDTGRIVLAETRFDLAKMVRDVVDEQCEAAQAGGIELAFEGPSRGTVLADSHMLRMVIENLLSNAIKYTPEGGSVTVRMMRRSNQWVLSVKDTGVGIAKSDFPKLFKQFTRIDNPRNEFVTGTGVGLYLAYHLTLLHDGQINVLSRKGEGSTFTLRIPRKI